MPKLKKNKIKVLVAMSGGVDSSVAAALLVEQGYEVTGMFAVNYDTDVKKSCWVSDYQDALRVSAHLGIPLLRWNFVKEYKKMVLDNMYREYSAGRTPNPDVMCNKFVKFGVWLDKAKKMGFDKLATGHYADIKTLKHKNIKTIKLLCAKDTNKDQTYFLHQLNQKQLAHTLFPLGDLLKSEVRSLARRFKLPTAEKEESMGICFIGEVPMKEFLETQITQKKGKITLSDGTIVGEHDGLAYYTIGQRHFGVESRKLKVESDNKPIYVIDKNIKKNQLIVGYENDPLLYKKEITITNLNWISGQPPKFPLKCEIRLRHRQELQQCVIKTLKHENMKTVVVEFKEPQRAVTPGQFAVFYLKGECLGGGVIK